MSGAIVEWGLWAPVLEERSGGMNVLALRWTRLAAATQMWCAKGVPAKNTLANYRVILHRAQSRLFSARAAFFRLRLLCKVCIFGFKKETFCGRVSLYSSTFSAPRRLYVAAFVQLSVNVFSEEISCR